MHQTLSNDIKGFIDSKTTGWCFHTTKGSCPMRFKTGDTIKALPPIKRIDVAECYNRPDISMCGWSLTEARPGEIQMELGEKWLTVFEFPDESVQISSEIPSFIVVDNFYKDPLSVRKFALKQQFQPDLRYFKGKRSECFRFDGLKERFEAILNRKIINWEKYGTNGCFQYCIAEDLHVYHCDAQQYAGVLFLTPDAPIQSGTQFFRSKHTRKMRVAKEEHPIVFAKGYYDSTEFESVDTVGNIFNRIVLFDARMIHAAPIYFGTKKEDARLFQLFFFDLE